MAARKILTEVGIRAALARAKRTGKPTWTADGAIPRSHGGLQLYAHPSGSARWFWRYSTADGHTARIALGPLAGEGTGGLMLPAARAAVAAKAALYRQPESRDVRAYEEAQRVRTEAKRQAAEEAERQRAEVARMATEEAGRLTLQALLDVYVAHLRQAGKASAYDVANTVRNHVTLAAPELAQKPAREITTRDAAALLRPLVEAGHGRTAGKLRSFGAAAFALAVKAEVDSTVAAAFIPFAVEANPFAATGTFAKFNRTLERALSEPELRAYYAAVKARPDSPIRDALLLGLLLGGQRTAQLLRATVADVDVTARTLRLFDAKGRRQQPRAHVLPLTDPTLEVVQRCIARADKQRAKRGGDGPRWLFSSHGSAAVTPMTLAHEVGDIAVTLAAKPEGERIIRAPFQLRDIRRTCETRLAALGISREARAQILSHGLGGVQQRSYDRHNYMDEKTAALAAWCAYLETAPAANVLPLRGKGRR